MCVCARRGVSDLINSEAPQRQRPRVSRLPQFRAWHTVGIKVTVGLVWPSYRKGPFQLAASICLFLPFDGGGAFGATRRRGGMKRKKDRRKRGGWREARTAGGGRLSLAFRKLSGVGCGTDIQKELEAKSASGGGNRSVQSPDARILGGSCIFLERLSRETHRRGPSFHF